MIQSSQQVQQFHSQQYLLQNLESQDQKIENDFRVRLQQENDIHKKQTLEIQQRIELLKKENEIIMETQKNMISVGKEWGENLKQVDYDKGDYLEKKCQDWIYEAKHDHLQDYSRIVELRENIKKYQEINKELYERNIEAERSNWRRNNQNEQYQIRQSNRVFIKPLPQQPQYVIQQQQPISIQQQQETLPMFPNQPQQPPQNLYQTIHPRNMPKVPFYPQQIQNTQDPNQDLEYENRFMQSKSQVGESKQLYAKYCPGQKTYI